MVLDHDENHQMARLLRQKDFVHVFQLVPIAEEDASSVPISSRRFRLQSIGVHPSTKDEEQQRGQVVTVTAEWLADKTTTTDGWGGVDCVLDAGVVYRSFRRNAKNTALFTDVCRLLQRLVRSTPDAAAATTATCRVLSVAPTKKFKRKDFFGHPELAWHVESHALASTSGGKKEDQEGGDVLIAFACAFGQPPSPSSTAPSAPSSSSSCKEEPSNNFAAFNDRKTAEMLALQQQLAARWTSAINDDGKDDDDLDLAAVAERLALEQTREQAQQAEDTGVVSVVFTGEIVRLRKFSHGMAFLTLGDPTTTTTTTTPAKPTTVQVFLEPKALQATLASAALVTQVLALVRKGTFYRVRQR